MFSVIVRGNLRVSFADWQQNTEAHVSLRVPLGLLINHSLGNRPIRFVKPSVAATWPHVALFKIKQSNLPNYHLRLPLSKFRYQTQPLCILQEAYCNRRRWACSVVCR